MQPVYYLDPCNLILALNTFSLKNTLFLNSIQMLTVDFSSLVDFRY